MDIDFARLHHAYLLVGDPQEAEESLLAVFKEAGYPLVGSPDFFISREATFGIDEARALSETAIRRAFVSKKVFFLAPEKITLEAQNALLKTFEEPIAETHFFLVVRDEGVIIPTLRSRMQALRLESEAPHFKEVEEYLRRAPAERLAFAKKFVDCEENLSAFLDKLLSLMRRTGRPLDEIKKVYDLRLESDGRGASPRLILEHLALVLPG